MNVFYGTNILFNIKMLFISPDTCKCKCLRHGYLVDYLPDAVAVTEHEEVPVRGGQDAVGGHQDVVQRRRVQFRCDLVHQHLGGGGLQSRQATCRRFCSSQRRGEKRKKECCYTTDGYLKSVMVISIRITLSQSVAWE